MERIGNKELLQNINKLNMEIWEMEMALLDKNWVSGNISSSFTRVYVMLEGEAHIKNGKREICMLPGNVYIIPAGMEFSYKCDDYAKKLYFHISVLMPDGYDLFNRFSDFIVFKNQDVSGADRMFRERTVSNIVNVKSYIYDIICKCLDGRETEQLHSYSELIRGTIDYIDKNLSAMLTVDMIAEKMFVSVSKLQKSFKTEIGMPIGKYIDDRLMFVAEKEIRISSKPVKEISDRLGYCDQFYFSRLFSKKYGIAPLKYRKICRKGEVVVD